MARELAKNLLEVRAGGVLVGSRRATTSAREAGLPIAWRTAALGVRYLPSGARLDAATAVRHLEADLLRAFPAVRNGASTVAVVATLREAAQAACDVVASAMGGPRASGAPEPTAAVPLAEGRTPSSAVAATGHAAIRAAYARGVREVGAVGVAPLQLSRRGEATRLPLACTPSPFEGGAANDADEVLNMSVTNGLQQHAPCLVGLGHGDGGQRQAA